MATGSPEKEVRKHDDESDPDVMEAVAADILEAIEAKSIRRLAEALRAAFDLSEPEPSYEGEHTNE